MLYSYHEDHRPAIAAVQDHPALPVAFMRFLCHDRFAWPETRLVMQQAAQNDLRNEGFASPTPQTLSNDLMALTVLQTFKGQAPLASSQKIAAWVFDTSDRDFVLSIGGEAQRFQELHLRAIEPQKQWAELPPLCYRFFEMPGVTSLDWPVPFLSLPHNVLMEQFPSYQRDGLVTLTNLLGLLGYAQAR